MKNMSINNNNTKNSERDDEQLTCDQAFNAHLQDTRKDINTHLYQRGFLTGLQADCQVRAFNQIFKLHRLIMVRSPLFETLLQEQEEQQQQQPTSQSLFHHQNATPTTPPPSQAIIELPISDRNVTNESLSIIFAYLYGGSVRPHLTGVNVFGVLACGNMFQLPDLCRLCTVFITDRLMSDSDFHGILMDSIAFINNASGNNAYGEWPMQLQKSCINRLTQSVSVALSAPEDRARMTELLQLFKRLPFDWLKTVLETHVQLPTEFAKFQFAKQVIDARKKHVSMPESVVMRFDQQDGGKVQVVQNVGKKPALLKHMQPKSNSQNGARINGHRH